MLYDLHPLDQDKLLAQLTTLIEVERDLTRPRHIPLIRMLRNHVELLETLRSTYEIFGQVY